MTEPFPLGAFLSRWGREVRHELAASDSETLPLAALLGMAGPDDLRRWEGLGLGYPDPQGASWLRAAIAARHHGLDGDDVLCCAGAQEAVACTVRALLAPGDHAVVVVPIYQPSEQAVTALCAATGVSLDDGDWRLDLGRVEAAIRPNTRLVLANFPNSPTGAGIDAATLTGLIALCRRHGLWLVNDEIYRQTDCDPGGGVPPVADLYERGISINGLSKGFGLPGLRVGWAACRDRDLLARALLAKSMLSSCLTAPSEVLAHVALRSEAQIVGRTRAIGRHNHRRLRALIGRHPALFEDGGTRNLAIAFPRFRGRDGVDRFATDLACEARLLVLPAGLWRSRLAPTPLDRLRVGLGHEASETALDLLDEHLRSRAHAERGEPHSPVRTVPPSGSVAAGPRALSEP